MKFIVKTALFIARTVERYADSTRRAAQITQLLIKTVLEDDEA